ncbi:MAG: hypothetical protein ACYC6P_03320 [Ignavibacteriaceae bacterium]
MKKLFPIILLASVLFNFNITFAQVGFTLNGGIQIPVGNFSNLVNNGYGVSGSIDYTIPIIPVGISLSIGYDNWPYKTQYSLSNSGVHEYGTGINAYSIPITLGPKVFLNIPGFSLEPYLGIDAGILFSSSTLAGATFSTNFIYSPMFGFRYSLPPGIIAIDINVKESNFNDSGSSQSYSWLGINGGISILL